MVNDRLSGGLLATVAILFAGCGQKWTVFEFENASSDETIVVDSLAPLTDPPPGGVIAPGGFAGGHMGVQEVPQRLTVSWRQVEENGLASAYGDEPDWTETEVIIANFDTFPRHERVSLKYLGDSKWETSFIEPE
jgi:hypothetical protein